MSEIDELIDAAAMAAVEHAGNPDFDLLPAYMRPGSEARAFVWNRHFADPNEPAQARRFAERLATESAEFRDQVASVERMFADELADDAKRLERVRAEISQYKKEQKHG